MSNGVAVLAVVTALGMGVLGVVQDFDNDRHAREEQHLLQRLQALEERVQTRVVQQCPTCLGAACIRECSVGWDGSTFSTGRTTTCPACAGKGTRVGDGIVRLTARYSGASTDYTLVVK